MDKAGGRIDGKRFQESNVTVGIRVYLYAGHEDN